jgi:uncharacterized membrane protein YuzA (DUF378 family)
MAHTDTHQQDYWLLRGLLGSAGAAHLVLGIMTLSGKTGVDVGARIYGVDKELDEQVYYVLGLAGVYLFSMGGLMTLAATDPRHYRGVIDFSLLLYVVNTYFRLRHMQDAERLFGVTSGRLWKRIAFLDTVGALIFWERMKLEREKIATEQTST